jgi:predicted NACHT family NTPase
LEQINMAYIISKRSLKASKEGIQLASRAILRFPTKIDFAAELEISRSTVQNFFAGKPVGRENFHKICQELNLSWQEVAGLPEESALTAINSNLVPHETETTQIVVQDSLVSKDPEPVFTVDSCDSLVKELRMQIKSRILSMCGTMRVLDMSSPMSIKDIYVDTQVYEKIKGRRRLEFGSINAEVKLKETSGLEVAKSYSKLIVLGKPGSGKTMFLKHLILQCLQKQFEPELVPIFVSVRDFVAYDPSLCLLNYITQQIIKDGQPIETERIIQLLNNGKFFIVIDGLDEAKTTSHQAICRHLRHFTQWFPNNRYILSCRHGVHYCNFEQFTEVEIADFKPKQIVDFAVKWFDAKDTSPSLSFLYKLEKNSSIEEFATNPLLLTLLCILFEDSKDFPSSRSEIYEEGLDIMLKQWDAERVIEREKYGLSLQQEKELLCYIAHKVFEKKQYFVKEVDLKFYITDYLTSLSDTEISQINVSKVLKLLEAKHGLLVEQAKKVYSFSHLAFQEYLTARRFVYEYDLQVSNHTLNHLVSHLSDEKWREIFLLVAEMSPQAEQMLEIMREQIDSQIAQFPDIKVFLDWVNCKTESVIINNYNQEAQFEPVTVRAFYFSLGLSQILGSTGSNFNLVLSFDPNFSRKLNRDFNLKLDLSLFHISSLGDNLESINLPALTFHNVLNRAIAYAIIIKPELAQELQTMKQQLPSVEEDTTKFWLWWHKQGQAWSNNINSLAIKYRNLGYQWKFNSQQQQALKNYYQTNLLLIDCLNNSLNVSPKAQQKLENQLLKSSVTNQTESQDMALMLQPSIA